MNSGRLHALGDNLLAKMEVLNARLAQSGIEYAFGGAIALDYYTEPRATTDFDVNVFCPESESGPLLDQLADLGIAVTHAARQVVVAQGQVRLDWGAYKVDLFFANTPFHDAMRRRVRLVPFLEASIPIIAPEHLLTCKAIFNRPKDWVDIANVRRSGTSFDEAEAKHWVAAIADDDVVVRFETALGEEIPPDPPWPSLRSRHDRQS